MATSTKKISKSIEINAPVQNVFAFLSDPNNLPEVWPAMVEVSNVQRTADGGHSFDFVYKMAGVRFNGRSETSGVELNKRVLAKTEGGIPSTFEYLYKSTSGGGTNLTINTDYTIPGQLLSKLADPLIHRINEHEADLLLKNVKARMELGKAAEEEVRAPVM